MTARITRMRRPLCGHARRAASSLARIAKLGMQVVRQTKARIFGGSTVHEKVVSIFEPTTKILRRGKPGRPTEFGHIVKVQEAENGLITDIGVVHTTDHALLVLAVERHAEVFGLPPRVATTDRGFYAHKGVERIESMGVGCATIRKQDFVPLQSSSVNENAPFEKHARGEQVEKLAFQDSRTPSERAELATKVRARSNGPHTG